jgi:hypothetical protein
MPTPIAYQKIQTSSGIKDIPLYNPADVSYPACRIQTPHGLGCYDLIAPTPQTPLRISTPQGIKGINLTVASSGPTPFLFANQSQTITWSTNVGYRGAGVRAMAATTITKVGVKGGATGIWSLWKLDNTTFNCTTQLASGTTLAVPNGSGYRLSDDISVPVSAGDNLLLTFQYASGIEASGTYHYQTGSSANSDSFFQGNNRMVSVSPTAGTSTTTGFTYDLVVYHI